MAIHPHNALTLEEAEWLDRIRAIEPKAQEWLELTRTPPKPEERSSLACDSLGELEMDVAIYYQLCIAIEHLHFAITSITQMQRTYPTAYMTVCRTGLIASTNALWLLSGPTRQVRQKRLCIMKSQEFQEQIAEFNSIPRLDGWEPDKTESLVAQIRAKQEWLQKIVETAGLGINVEKQKLNQTDVIEQTIKENFKGDDSDTKWFRYGISNQWRSGSAAAHARSQYGMKQLGAKVPEAIAKGQKIVTLTASLDGEIGPAVSGVFMVLKEAIRIFGLRSVCHLRPGDKP
ncbi:hypothetical protein CKALI_08640 [Corynebacterium kalinowskii]|uniref:Uncharacterized protein n=1 Tax=Corynebacterium kalinowskii TaxID=2675216 RepID=A0A6B8VSH5_9CORY|nr:hypothetical protein [Corynebacterium kalinowskii]QGU02587.1 hypothetical protein CKALI_08640 [Corynebacterium kalinowskii]